MNWNADFEISGAHPLPTVLAIMGFIAILIGVPALFLGILGVFAILFIIGWIMIGLGVCLWVAERSSTY